jgi:hypothetical protein
MDVPNGDDASVLAGVNGGEGGKRGDDDEDREPSPGNGRRRAHLNGAYHAARQPWLQARNRGCHARIPSAGASLAAGASANVSTTVDGFGVVAAGGAPGHSR